MNIYPHSQSALLPCKAEPTTYEIKYKHVPSSLKRWYVCVEGWDFDDYPEMMTLEAAERRRDYYNQMSAAGESIE